MLNLFYNEYFYVFVLLFFSIFLASLILFLSLRLGSYNPDSEKLSAYECGFDPYEDARNSFDVRFYLVAIIFILFDLEAAFFFSVVCISWIIKFRRNYMYDRFYL